MSSTQIGLLWDVFTRTEHILAKLTSQDLDLPTPCTDFDVRRLRDHLIGWTCVFAALPHRRPGADHRQPDVPFRA